MLQIKNMCMHFIMSNFKKYNLTIYNNTCIKTPSEHVVVLNVKLKLSQNVMYIYSPYFSDISKINIAFAAKDR